MWKPDIKMGPKPLLRATSPGEQTRHKATFEVPLFENMSEDSMVELHVRLLGKGTDCSRPTKAINTGNE